MASATKKILIVEDSENYRWVLSQAFSQEGFAVAEAGNGEDGLVVAKKEKPDIILLDITMPKMDGITLSRRLKEANVQVPIIFLTNMGDMKHISDAAETATDYIVKSEVSVGDIVSRIKTKLSSKQ